MSLIDIIIVLTVAVLVYFSFKSVRRSLKEGKCSSCSHKCDCEKNNEELQKGYEEWLKKKNTN